MLVSYLGSFPLLERNIQFEEEIYFGLWIQRFQSMAGLIIERYSGGKDVCLMAGREMRGKGASK